MEGFTMTKRPAKLMSISLATIMAAGSLLAACGSNTEEPKKGELTPVTSTKPEVKGKISSAILDRSTTPAEEGTIDKNRWTDWIQKNAPVDVSFVPVMRDAAKQKDKYNVLFAGGTAPDLIFDYNAQNLIDWYNMKQLIPLDDIIEKYSTTYKSLLKQFPELKKVTTGPDGKIYTFAKIGGVVMNDTILIRKDWLDKLKLEMPKTVDDLLKVAIAFAEQDPDGNGKKDTFGINISPSDGLDQVNKLFGDWNTQLGYNLVDGKLVRRMEATKAAADFKRKLFDVGAVDKDFLVNKPDKAKQDWVNGKLGIYTNGSLNGSASLATYQSLKKNVASAQVAPLPYPETQFGKLNPLVTSPFNSFAGINATAKDPAAVMKYVDWLVSEEVGETLRNGQEGVHWKADANGCPQPIDPEKNKKETSYLTDFNLLTMSYKTTTNCPYENLLDTKDPIQKEYYDLVKKMNEVVFDPTREFVQPISSYPDYKDDLSVIKVNVLKNMSSIWDKSIVDSKYPMDKALEDAKAVWIKEGGPKLDEYAAKWYETNKGNLMMTKDLVKMKEKLK
jgi:putative aldouronate transport system substrate-binding protein